MVQKNDPMWMEEATLARNIKLTLQNFIWNDKRLNCKEKLHLELGINTMFKRTTNQMEKEKKKHNVPAIQSVEQIIHILSEQGITEQDEVLGNEIARLKEVFLKPPTKHAPKR